MRRAKTTKNRGTGSTCVLTASTAVWLLGCLPPIPPLGDDEASSDGSSTASSTTGEDPMTADESDGEDPRLDLAGGEDPNADCALVSQTTEIEEGPADILVIADAGVSELERTDALTNLLPYIESVGVTDAQVIWITGPAPQQDSPDLYPGLGCGESWICPSLESAPPYVHIEDEVPSGSILSALLSTHDQWDPHLRPDAVKHVWVISSTRQDTTLSIDDFDASFSGLGTGFSAYTFHAKLPSDDLEPVAGDDFRELATARGGHFYDPIDQQNYNIEIFFDEVLDRISAASLSCEYVIPEPPDGHTFDRDEVNVLYDDGLGPRTIGYVPSVAECASVSAGWYYDDDDAPTRLIMCPNVCAAFEANDNASIEIQFGCATIPAG